MRVPRLLQRLLLAVAALAAFDVVLARTWLASGRLGERPLPPFGAITDPVQLAALERAESGEGGLASLSTFDRELGWTLRPGAHSENGETSINADGERGARVYAPEPAAGVLRLACYGDSFTYGDEVPDRFSYPAILEAEDPRIEALNCGVPAYGTDQALLRFRRDGRRGAQVVCIGLLLENIGRNVNRYRPLWYPRSGVPAAKPRFVLDGERLVLVPQPFADVAALAASVRDGSVLGRIAEHEYWLGRPEVWTGRWSALGRLIGGYLAYTERAPERLWLERDGEPRRTTVALVEEFHREALASGARDAVVLIFPLKKELFAFAADGAMFWQELVSELEARRIPHLDLVAPLAEAHRRCTADPSLGTVYFGGHLSSVGNAVVARTLREWLIGRGLLTERRR